MNLKDVLRKGDPATGDPGLSPEEIREMRRTVLSAVPEPRRRGLLWPALVVAMSLFAVAGLFLDAWRGISNLLESPTRAASEEREVAPSPAQRGRVGEGSSSPAPKRPLPFPPPRQGAGEGASHPPRDVKVARVRPHPRPVPKPEPTVKLAKTETQQQIQFSTPGGTRVIWVLNRTAD